MRYACNAKANYKTSVIKHILMYFGVVIDYPSAA